LVVRMLGVVAFVGLLALLQAAPVPHKQGKVLENVQGITANRVIIPDEYIVVFKKNIDVNSHFEWLNQALTADAFVRFKYDINDDFKGYSGRFPRALLAKLKARSEIAYIDFNEVASINAEQTNPPSWGLDRVDQRNLPLNSLYVYDDGAGSGTAAYIIDTGISAHNDYTGRWFWGANYVGDNINYDCNGHGTHVAGTVGGTQYGIAKQTSLYAVKVLGCGGSGAWDGVISGINYVTSQHQAGSGKKTVANMSLGGSFVASVNDAVDASSAAGVIHVVASGNNAFDACYFSPASAPTAISVNSCNRNDQFSSFSNRGTCTDITAPGEAIVSTYNTCATCTASLSGTSMAAPHVAGTVALRLFNMGPTSPASMLSYLQSVATSGVISGTPANTNNLLLYSQQ